MPSRTGRGPQHGAQGQDGDEQSRPQAADRAEQQADEQVTSREAGLRLARGGSSAATWASTSGSYGWRSSMASRVGSSHCAQITRPAPMPPKASVSRRPCSCVSPPSRQTTRNASPATAVRTNSAPTANSARVSAGVAGRPRTRGAEYSRSGRASGRVSCGCRGRQVAARNSVEPSVTFEVCARRG